MGHARLVSLRLKGFRSFINESEINFPESGMMLFRGRNLDSGGSSGSGKSSLLLAITYLLGFCRFPATALQSWLTEEPLQVTGTFEVDDGKGARRELVISRGQKLTLSLNGTEVEGSAKQLEDKITKYIGLPPELLAALTYRGQKQPGLFLSKTDAQKKEFLTTLLDLGKFEEQVERSTAAVKTLESKVQGSEYLVAKLTSDIQGRRENFKPALVADEKNLQSQLDMALAHSDRIRGQVAAIRAKVKSFEASVEDGALKIRAEAQARINELNAAISDLEDAEPDLSKIDSSLVMDAENDLKVAQGFLDDELKADQTLYKTQRQHADSVHAQLLLIEKKLASKPVLQRRRQELAQQIASLAADICPTCERQWDQAHLQVQALHDEMAATIKEFNALETLKPEIERLQAEYKTLGEFKPSPAIEELRAITTQLTQKLAEENGKLQAEIKAASQDLERKLIVARQELAVARANVSESVQRYRSIEFERIQDEQEQLETLDRELQMSDAQANGIRAALTRVQIDNTREKERVAQLEANIKAMEVDLLAEAKALAEIKAKMNAELDFQKLVGREGFLGAIFDEVLWEISEETNRLLAQFPNTAHVTLYFRSENVTGKGTIQKKILPVVSIGGFEAPLASGLSGGMETAVELAVDLAVATVVSRRTGSTPGWLILDESFTGMGPVEAEGSIEILRAFAENNLVLVVDHASEFKSMFTQHVDVEFSNGSSRVVA